MTTPDQEQEARPSESYARRQNVIAASVLFVVGAGAALLSWQLGIGDLADPGPGMWPLIVSVAMAVIAVVLVVRSAPTGEEERFGRESLVVAAGVVSLLGYVFLFERVGFEIPTVALLVLWLKLLGRESWLMTAIVSLSATTAIYLLFITGLGVSLPHIVHF
ncbi:tripartite tricarboxylate transporter TctB family protein [Prauserella cavernicola]|uniref:Tripartite tricarboxylate transporter TctB family protein n=1 Tax=Prauserella cavernicola TaxID=2800127 RepID=A0A934QUL8_9PSEU|nr:tripartite tricarboxylate transporter TctB family protein [Prauserella cavernicola]MBK1786765.1 tripartite tricarboxylate transporter TctB family protein [Prauserella cavernicola]